MSIDNYPSRNERSRPDLGFGGVTEDGDIYAHWIWTIDEEGNSKRGKYIGPGTLKDRMTGEVVERNRPGSPYIELDYTKDGVIERLADYRADVLSRLRYNNKKYRDYSYDAPELHPRKEDVEYYVLNRLIDLTGVMNLWEMNQEVANFNNGLVPNTLFQAYSNLTSALDLEVKTIPDFTSEIEMTLNPNSTDEAVAPKRNRLLGAAASAASGVASFGKR